jgi:hypothetical protein
MRRRWREPAAIAAEIDRIRSLLLDALGRLLKPADPDHGALVQELAQARACIAQQAAEIARLRLRKPAAESARTPATKPANPDSELGRLKATIVLAARPAKAAGAFLRPAPSRVPPRPANACAGRL